MCLTNYIPKRLISITSTTQVSNCYLQGCFVAQGDVIKDVLQADSKKKTKRFFFYEGQNCDWTQLIL